jgi:RNA polymerase sigma-70 factor, ECF subfamily
VATLGAVDRNAAGELFNACYPRLAGWIRPLVGNDDTAHEIASEAFTRLLARWTTLDSPRAYLYVTAANLVNDHWRKSGRERRAITRLITAVPPEPAGQLERGPDVRGMIDELPHRLGSVLLLRYYAGFTVREVATVLGRAEGTVKADLHHARSLLRAALGNHPAGRREALHKQSDWLPQLMVSRACGPSDGAKEIYDDSVSSTNRIAQIDSQSPVPLHEQVAAALRRAIADGEASPGERLPPARDLAAVLGVNSNTVLRALRTLRDEGLVEFRRGRGVTVTGEGPERSVVVAKARELVLLAQRFGYRPEELTKIIEQVS